MINLSADEWEFKVSGLNREESKNLPLEVPTGTGWMLIEWKIYGAYHRFLWARKREGQPYR